MKPKSNIHKLDRNRNKHPVQKPGSAWRAAFGPAVLTMLAISSQHSEAQSGPGAVLQEEARFYGNSWIDSESTGPNDEKSEMVHYDCDEIDVLPDGRVITISNSHEGGYRSCHLYPADGVAPPIPVGANGFGLANNGTYLFTTGAGTIGSSGNKKTQNSISRRLISNLSPDSPADDTVNLFEGQREKVEATIEGEPGEEPEPHPQAGKRLTREERWQRYIGGIAVDATHAYATSPYERLIYKVDLANFTSSGVSTFEVGQGQRRPKNIVVDNAGFLWISEADEDFGNYVIRKYNANGNYQGVQINDPFGGTTNNWEVDDLAIDQNGNLLVADSGYGDQILRYTNLTGTPVKDSWTLGKLGGITAGPVPGEAEPFKLNSPTGVGVDQFGNIYVGANGSSQYGGTQGAQLKKFGAGGQHQWTLDGLIYWDAGTADPEDLNTVYTKFLKFELDYNAPDQEGLVHPSWEEKSWTLDARAYPDDPRAPDHTLELNLEEVTTPELVRIGGEKFLVLAKNSVVAYHRFDGEVAVPCLIFGKPHVQYNFDPVNNTQWPANNPFDPSNNLDPNTGKEKSEEWIWKDGSATSGPNAGIIDGQIDSNEYVLLNTKALQWSSHIDSEGSLWILGENNNNLRIQYFKLDVTNKLVNGIPNYQAPREWDFKQSRYHEDLGLARIDNPGLQYDVETDSLYISGNSADTPLQNPPETSEGADNALPTVVGVREIRRYDDWLDKHDDNDSNTWPTVNVNEIIIPPYDGIPRNRVDQIRGQAWDVEGDFIFLRYDMNAFATGGARGEILVYNKSDHSYVGTLQAKNFVWNMANDGGIQAYKREVPNEATAYLIFMTALPNGTGAYHEWYPDGQQSPNPAGLHQIISKSNPSLALDVAGQAKGSNVLLTTDTDAPTQFWDVKSWPTPHHRFDNGEYTNRTLEIWSGNANIYDNSEKDWKKFVLLDNMDGTYSIQCIHPTSAPVYLTASGTSNGSNVTGTAFTGNDNQKWLFVAPGGGPPTGGTVLYSEDFENGESYSNMNTIPQGGGTAGISTAPVSGAVVARHNLNPEIDVTGLTTLNLSMDVVLPDPLNGTPKVWMIVQFDTANGSQLVDGAQLILADTPGVTQAYSASINLPANPLTIKNVRVRIQGSSGSSDEDIYFDNITVSSP